MAVELDRTFYNISSDLAEPFCTVSEWCHRLISPLNSSYKLTHRVLNTGMVAFAALVCVVVSPFFTLGSIVFLGMICRQFRQLAFALQKKPFIHVLGRAPEKPVHDIKLMTWNILGFTGGLQYSCGGCIPWRDRLGGIVAEIQKSGADVVVLQEVFDTALAEALIEQFRGEFAHFYIHLGPNSYGMESGCMVFTKTSVSHFSNHPFSNNKWTMRRGFAILEIDNKVRIVATHLEGHSSAKGQEQFLEMVHYLASLPSLPTIIAGDLNIERDSEEGKLLSRYLIHGYLGDKETCTSELSRQWTRGPRTRDEKIDYISLLKPGNTSTIKECRVIPAFDSLYNPQTALSDHHALTCLIINPKVK